MGELEPVKEIRSHELCVVVEGVAPTKKLAEETHADGHPASCSTPVCRR